MRAEIKSVLAWATGLALTTASRFLLPESTKIPTIHPGIFWPASVATIALVVRKLAGGAPLPQSMLNANFTGKTIVITGPAAGLGFQSALFFAVRGATVILGARSVARNEDTAKRLRAEASRGNVNGDNLKLITRYVYDAEDLNGVKKFANDLVEYFSNSRGGGGIKLDYLLCNAGMLDWANNTKSKFHPEIEYTACINSFAPLLLTEILMPTLKRDNTRVVVVSSVAHRRLGLAAPAAHSPENQNKVIENFKCLWGDYNTFSKLGKWPRYGYSKLFNIYHADYLASQGLEVATLHPGVVATNFVQGAGKIIELLVQTLGPYLAMKTEFEGAITQIYCCLCKPAPPVEDVTCSHQKSSPDYKNKLITKKSTYYIDSRCSNDELTAYGWDVEIGEQVVGFALEKLKEFK